MRLLLIRHGQTTANANRILDTAPPGHSLTDLGREEAQNVADLLAHEDIGAILASDLVRTQETAAPLAAALGLDVQVHADGREIFGGDLEDATEDAAFEEYAHTSFSWLEGDRTTRLANGESGEEVLERFDRQVARAAAATEASGKSTGVIFAHGAIIRIWTGCRAIGADASFIAAHPMPNTAIVDLDGAPENGWVLKGYAGLTAQQIADGIDDALAEELAVDERQTFGG